MSCSACVSVRATKKARLRDPFPNCLFYRYMQDFKNHNNIRISLKDVRHVCVCFRLSLHSVVREEDG